MSGSIIQTALTKGPLHLELEYRQPSLLQIEDANNEGPMTDLELAAQETLEALGTVCQRTCMGHSA